MAKVTGLGELIPQCARYVTASDHGQLLLGWRLRLWSAMDRRFGDESLHRRSVLAFVVARETLRVSPASMLPDATKLAQEILDVCSGLLRGTVSCAQAGAFRKATFPQVQQASHLFDELGDPAYVPMAASQALAYALGEFDGYYQARDVTYAGEPSLYEQSWAHGRHLAIDEAAFDPESREPHYFASFIAAWDRRPPHPFEYDVGRMRGFWLDWVNHKLPLVLTSSRRDMLRLLE